MIAEFGTPERVEAELAAIRDEWRDFVRRCRSRRRTPRWTG